MAKTIDKPKSLSPFDFLANLTYLKVKWNDYTEDEKKSFDVYMINRILSMDSDWIELVNSLQKITLSSMSSKDVYQLYFDLLPKKKIYNKYLKAENSVKYDDEMIKLVSLYFQTSNANAVEYIDMLKSTESGKVELNDILNGYSLTDKEIKKMMK